MSGPNPPGPEDAEQEQGKHAAPEPAGGDHGPAAADHGTGEDESTGGPTATGETDVVSQAYSAPESEHFTSAPYVPGELVLYDYDDYLPAVESDEQQAPPKWPWVVGVTAIIAAISLVVSVSLLVSRTDTDQLANPQTSTRPAPPVQDEITTTVPPPPATTPEAPPPPPPPPPPETVTVTQEPPPPPPPPAEEAPPPVETTGAPPPPATTTPPATPRQVTYSVTGTKAPGDIITITFVESNGRRRTLRNVYIPWSFTVTPISQSDVGSVEASSLFLVSKLNCSITASDGTVLSSNNSNSAQTAC